MPKSKIKVFKVVCTYCNHVYIPKENRKQYICINCGRKIKVV